MDASLVRLSPTPVTAAASPKGPPEFEPVMEKMKQRLLKHGVHPTPKIIRNLRKKELQKYNRRIKRQSESDAAGSPVVTEAQRQALEEETHFRTLRREYKQFTRAAKKGGGAGQVDGDGGDGGLIAGKPWEGMERARLKELVSGGRREEVGGGKLRRENLDELKEMLEQDLRWVLEDDIELEGLELSGNDRWGFDPGKRWASEGDAIKVLVNRLSSREITEKHWKFVRMMKQSGLQFTEAQLLKIVDRLGHRRSWKQASAVVHWVYSDKQHKHLKSRFVYTKLLSVLGMARRPEEALQIFNKMLGDRQLYPDIAVYHSIAVTLGQAGLLKELLKVIECMRQKPTKLIKNSHQKNWDPVLEPDLVVYNAVLNACVPSRQWKGVSWVFAELRKGGLRPNGATYGLAMEVMLESEKYELVHEFFRKMKSSGETPKAITYRVLVRSLWREGKIEEAVEAVRDMEQRGVVGTGSVYYELACCLCNNGHWRDAMLEVERMKRLENCKPLEITFTGLISASLGGGHIDDCIAIFCYMKDHCCPNIGTVNTMFRVYGRNDMFSEAKKLFEEINGGKFHALVPDEYTYSLMLEASARALQWEYFEFVYQKMTLSGYQLDQTKHVLLLIEASRAGKWRLLEHAFDTLLEGGEIPHPMLFTEMLCHATAQDDYRRAIALIDTVALAPFQIDEEQWTDLFEENREWITQENLEKLLDCLHDCDYAAEPTVINLSRSLKSLCGISSSKMVDDIERPVDDLLIPTTDSPYITSVNGNERRVVDVLSDTSDDEPLDFTESELQTLGLEELVAAGTDGEEDEEHAEESDSPPAYEILKEWENSRRKDGMVQNSALL
ncbi:PREDICTED: pentatricopeptide repeat-containing protein At5g67570, chloroplastic [Tarenaya hassleriana]|uniref:pentatricopeptide repeat-containing protein At5g67570, chloroplastic n=1 Tax=Tarenaya hassleriana TaxID=28532 RepID=UPI00053C2B31|nr:PREDICTED: pentatricopeptide repeat-containing protein At5g67570, chloroplastic [Tarenaya hassleriana]